MIPQKKQQQKTREVENNSNDIVNIGVSDIALNSLTVESGSWTSETVNPGKRCIINVIFSNMLYKNIWELYGIDEIGEIKFALNIHGDSYYDIIDSSDISITIPNAKAFFDGSGKDYKKHNALDKIMSVPEWKFDNAYVFCKGNIEACEGINYIPLYMLIFYKPDEFNRI